MKLVHQSQLPMQSSWSKMCGCRRTERKKKNAKSGRQGPPNLPQADDMCDSLVTNDQPSIYIGGKTLVYKFG